MGLGETFFFDRDWLRIEGASNDEHFDSSNFQFERLEYPHEWAARVLRRDKVRLRVGERCNCVLDSIAAYTKSDQTAWLRLQFDRCRDCESTATRAAVVVPVAEAEEGAVHASNLYAWMCALSDHAACHGPPPTATTSTKGPSTAPPTDAPTTHVPNCDFEGALSVRTLQKDYGHGRCLTDGLGGTSETHHAPSKYGCQIACDLSFTSEAANFVNMEDIEAHIWHINHRQHTCKGYAYNKETKTCAIYYGANNSYDYADGDPAWRCIGNVHVDKESFTYSSNYGEECTTLPPSTTTTTGTSTTATTTSTSTQDVAFLSLKDLFAVQPEEGTVFNTPGETHFPRRGMEATLLSLQSDCYWDIDYYLMGSPLPVAKSTWPSLLHLMSQFGESAAWPAQSFDCPASVTVDRLPVDADVAHNGYENRQLTGREEATFRFLLPLLMGAVVTVLALWFKSILYPQGLEPHADMGHAELAGVVLAACFAGVVACFCAFWVGQLASWFFRRLAVKKFALGFASNLYSAAPVLSSIMLPVAITVACATLVTFVWPKDEQSHQMHYLQKELEISYDTLTGEMTHMIN